MTDQSPVDDPAGDHPPGGHPLGALAARARGEIDTLDHEIAEIDLLVQQAGSEASRHETKRIAASEKLTALAGNRSPDLREVADLNAQLVTLTKRVGLMEAQVEVLAGKQKVLARYRDALGRYATDSRRSPTRWRCGRSDECTRSLRAGAAQPGSTVVQPPRAARRARPAV
jgi:chromosome segregation ATPase